MATDDESCPLHIAVAPRSCCPATQQTERPWGGINADDAAIETCVSIISGKLRQGSTQHPVTILFPQRCHLPRASAAGSTPRHAPPRQPAAPRYRNPITRITEPQPAEPASNIDDISNARSLLARRRVHRGLQSARTASGKNDRTKTSKNDKGERTGVSLS